MNKKWFKLNGKIKIMNNIKEYNKHISKIYKKFNNDKIPVDIISLCESYNQKPLFTNEKKGFPFSCIITKKMLKNQSIDEYEYFLLINDNDAMQRRLKVAVLFSALYMFSNDLCSKDEFENSIIIRDSVDTDSVIYKFAIMLLCPKFKLENIIRASGQTPVSILANIDYQKYVEAFLVSHLDFEYRLKMLVDEDV